MRIQFEGIELDLLPQKAVYMPKAKALVIGDVHIGKTRDLQREGIRIPSNAKDRNELRIMDLLCVYQPDQCFFLGDLFHFRRNSEFAIVSKLIAQFPTTEFILIRGNHEILSDKEYESLGLTVMMEARVSGLDLRHHPDLQAERPSLSGHIHPKIRLSGPGREVVSLPVFAQAGKCLVLPAFGALTGGYRISPRDYDAVYLVGEHEVIRMK